MRKKFRQEQKRRCGHKKCRWDIPPPHSKKGLRTRKNHKIKKILKG